MLSITILITPNQVPSSIQTLVARHFTKTPHAGLSFLHLLLSFSILQYGFGSGWLMALSILWLLKITLILILTSRSDCYAAGLI